MLFEILLMGFGYFLLAMRVFKNEKSLVQYKIRIEELEKKTGVKFMEIES